MKIYEEPKVDINPAQKTPVTMAGNLQQNPEQQKEPFSPLQTGCAVLMLTNMLIYLSVVLFTFNLLDPSKIDASYLAARGFIGLPTLKSKQDTAFQQLSREKHKQQVQSKMINSSQPNVTNPLSPAVRLSQIKQRTIGSSLPEKAKKPRAALTESSLRTGNSAPRIAPSRLYSVSIYPQATLPKSYSPIEIYSPKTLGMENYETLPVEMASGIHFPIFSLPSTNSAGAYLYRTPNPIPEASRGGLKLSSPPVGAQSLYTNETKKAKEPPKKKPAQKPPATSFN